MGLYNVYIYNIPTELWLPTTLTIQKISGRCNHIRQCSGPFLGPKGSPKLGMGFTNGGGFHKWWYPNKNGWFTIEHPMNKLWKWMTWGTPNHQDFAPYPKGHMNLKWNGSVLVEALLQRFQHLQTWIVLTDVWQIHVFIQYSTCCFTCLISIHHRIWVLVWGASVPCSSWTTTFYHLLITFKPICYESSTDAGMAQHIQQASSLACQIEG